ncbi:MAG: ABC transporter permease [Pontibacterium sp.]
MKKSNVIRLGIKELRSLAYDKVLLILIVWAFSGAIYMAATGASMEMHNASIAVVDEDQSALSLRIMDAFYKPYFQTPERITASEIDAGMDSGRYTFVLVIPFGLERDLRAGRQPEVQLNIDATRMNQAFIGGSYIQTIITAEVSEFVKGYRESTALPIELAVRVAFNPNLTGLWFGGVMEIINNITMLSIILTGAALIREREHGTIEHLLVMPVSPFEIMLAKVWAMGLVVLVASGLSLYLVVQGLLSVPVTGSIPLFLFGAALHLFSSTSIGIFLGTVARSMPQFGLLMILLIIPLLLLSGGMTPREGMPEVVQVIMLAAPTTHFVSFAQAILYRGAGLDVVWPDFLAISGIGVLFFLAALARFRSMVAMMR